MTNPRALVWDLSGFDDVIEITVLWSGFNRDESPSDARLAFINNITFHPVPEPSTWALVALGFAALVFGGRLMQYYCFIPAGGASYMPVSLILAGSILVAWVGLGCAQRQMQSDPDYSPRATEGSIRSPSDSPSAREGAPPATLERAPTEEGHPSIGSIDTDATYLQPNVRDVDGVAAYVHVTPDDMPLRVAIGHPRVPARYGSRADTRLVAIEAMRMWEEAIQALVSWFRLEFVENDLDAAVQVLWKSRIAGPWGGFGGIQYRVEGERLRVGGEMQVSTTPLGSYGIDARMELDHIRVLIAHEFGHVLGLMHCLDCESAMNYAWHTRGRVIVTELDALTFAALVQVPNGIRVDGRSLTSLHPDNLPDVGSEDDR